MRALPPQPLDTAAITTALLGLQDTAGAQLRGATGTAWRPATLAQALQVRADAPDALVVAGSTDTGLWINKQHQRPAQTLDLGGVAELGRITREANGLDIGAGARLEDAFQALAQEHPSVAGFLARFAGLPVRNAGTLGGNIVNGSPIGDSMPLLLALDARLTLASVRGSRELPLAQFYTGYRRNHLAADELLTRVRIPASPPGLLLGAWKVSKRLEDDISAVCLAVAVQREGGRIVNARIGVGGMAATCSRAPAAEAALVGQEWSLATLQAGAAALRGEFTPIDDLRASAAYRTEVIGNLLLRLWADTEPGHDHLGGLRALTA
jgi:xanthine dehydrogenase small subunit